MQIFSKGNAAKKREDEAKRLGIEKGKKEEKYEIAKKMKMKGILIKEISEITGLTVKEIENLE